MTPVADKITQAAWRLVPAPVERKLRTEAGTRFTRFVPVAIAALITSQVVLGLLTGPVDLSAGVSGVIAAMCAALVSYVLSRWAWERKGRPDLLRETLPFWAVSIAVWIILGLTSHFASVWAHSMGYTHFKKHLVVQGAYFLMNCVTFVARFLIFHYILFANNDLDVLEGPAVPPGRAVPPGQAGQEVQPDMATAETASGSDTGPMALVSGDSTPPPRLAGHGR
jgi:putative flippase GtrA